VVALFTSSFFSDAGREVGGEVVDKLQALNKTITITISGNIRFIFTLPHPTKLFFFRLPHMLELESSPRYWVCQ
jgi:hypothetical protein